MIPAYFEHILLLFNIFWHTSTVPHVGGKPAAEDGPSNDGTDLSKVENEPPTKDDSGVQNI